MSSTPARTPAWFWEWLGVAEPAEGASFELRGAPYVYSRGIPRSRDLHSATQASTSDAFGYKWKRRDTFDSEASRRRMREWLVERYGDPQGWMQGAGDRPLIVDAGCGAALSALELFDRTLERCRYVGVDVSEAVDVARERFAERGLGAAFVQADLGRLPFPDGSVDVVFSEGVLHHTDSTERALKAVAKLLKPGGRLVFYVYRKKGPVREFTDDYVRDRLQSMSPEESWRAMEPLTRLGIALGELDREIDIPEPIELLGIPAGRISVQRFFYWHVAKAFYHPELSFEEMNHINYDWYAPANAHRQSPEEVRRWCEEAGLRVEREVVEEAGITAIAVRTA